MCNVIYLFASLGRGEGRKARKCSFVVPYERGFVKMLLTQTLLDAHAPTFYFYKINQSFSSFLRIMFQSKEKIWRRFYTVHFFFECTRRHIRTYTLRSSSKIGIGVILSLAHPAEISWIFLIFLSHEVYFHGMIQRSTLQK